MEQPSWAESERETGQISRDQRWKFGLVVQGNTWAGFLRGLVERGLAGVRLVISDAHRRLVRAVHETLLGA